jgi:hypothetical protein
VNNVRASFVAHRGECSRASRYNDIVPGVQSESRESRFVPSSKLGVNITLT